MSETASDGSEGTTKKERDLTRRPKSPTTSPRKEEGKKSRGEVELSHVDVHKLVSEMRSEKGIVEDRKVSFKIYKRSVSGRDLVNWLIQHSYSSTSSHAASIAQLLLDSELLLPISSSDLTFKDDKSAIYRFKADQESENLEKQGRRRSFKLLKHEPPPPLPSSPPPTQKAAPKSERNTLSSADVNNLQKNKQRGSITDEIIKFEIPTEDVLDAQTPKEVFQCPLDITVTKLKRTYRTENASVPKDLNTAALELYNALSIKYFTKEFTTVQLGNEQLDGKSTLNSTVDYKELPDLNYDVDSDFFTETDSPSRKKRTPAKDSPSNEKRVNLFEVFSVNELKPTDDRTAPPFFAPHKGIQLVVECKELSFKIGDLEPLFCTVMLFNAKKGQRVSESFHFTLNPILQDNTTKSRKRGVFNIAEKSDLYLLLIVEKVLQGDYDDIAECYLKPESVKPKDRTKITDQIKASLSRLSKYTQLLAFGYSQIFDPFGQFRHDKDPNNPGVYYTTLDMFAAKNEELLFNSFSERETKKLKQMPCQCKFELQLLSEVNNATPNNRVDPMWIPVLPKPSTDTDVMDFEILEFSDSLIERDGLKPHTEYCNLLYIYPEEVNLSSSAGRNIAVRVSLLASDENINAPEALKVFYGSTETELVDSAITAVAYHQKQPKFHEEFKVNLPLPLNTSHHLLFTFYHIKVTKEKKGKDVIEVPIGYSFLPLYPNAKILEEKEYQLPVALSLAPQYLNPKTDLKWMEGKKALFTLRIKLNSTVYTADASLNQFFQLIQAHKHSGAKLDEENAFKLLNSANAAEIVYYFPVIMDLLFSMLSHPNSDSDPKRIFTAIIDVLKSVRTKTHLLEEEFFRHPLLQTYVYYQFDESVLGDGPPLHEELCRFWLISLRTSQTIREMFADNNVNSSETWQFAEFFLSVLLKTMVLHLYKNGKLESKDAVSKYDRPADWWSADFIENLQNLITALAETLIYLSGTAQPHEVKSYNCAVSLFLKDLLRITHKSFIFNQIQRYLLLVNQAPKYADDFKLTLLSVITDTEHYIALTAPIITHIESSTDILNYFWYPVIHVNVLTLDSKRYFLCGLMVKETVLSLLNITSVAARSTALAVFRNLLRKHDLDSRYQSTAIRGKIAAIYFPFIITLCENVQLIAGFEKAEKVTCLIAFMWLIRNCDRDILSSWCLKEIDHSLGMLELFSMAVDLFEYIGKEQILKRTLEAQATTKPTASLTSSQRKALIEGIYSKLSNSDETPSSSAASASEATNRFTLRDALRVSKMKRREQQLGEVTVASATAEYNRLTRESHQSVATDNASINSSGTSSRDDKESVSRRSTQVFTLPVPAAAVFSEHTVTQEAYLSREINLTVMSVLSQFINHVSIGAESNLKLTGAVVDLLVMLLKKNEPHSLIINLFALIRSFLHNCKRLLFGHKDTLHFSANLSYELLRQCHSNNESTRNEACKLLFEFIKVNWEVTHSISRMKHNIAVNISKLAGQPSKSASHFENLRSALERVALYAKQEKDSSFVAQLEAVTNRLFKVLAESIKISRYVHDKEMTAEIFHKISNGYNDSPELRAIWLESLSNLHLQSNHNEEAAQCLIALCSLVTEFLLQHKHMQLYIDRDTYQRICPNIKDELPLNFAPDQEDNEIHSEHFTLAGLIELLKQAAQLLKKAELYEICLIAYNALTNLYQIEKSYDKLYVCYQDLQAICKLLAEKQNARLFSSFYRVAFYGEPFEDLNGKQFIYKETRGTVLSDIVRRLKKQLKKQLGADTEISVLPNINDDKLIKDLDPKKCYFQVISVQPYFEAGETRTSLFEQKFKIDQFIFETPFTLEGAAQSEDLSVQYKKKTILKSEKYFPYLLKRLPVVSKREVILTPIENAIELLELRCKALSAEINARPPNAKSLHNVLQGTVLAQVHAGPLQICAVFLDKSNASKYSEEHLKKLKKTIADFLLLCKTAIELSSGLVKEDQAEFQISLEQGYHDIKLQILQKYSIELPGATAHMMDLMSTSLKTIIFRRHQSVPHFKKSSPPSDSSSRASRPLSKTGTLTRKKRT